MNLDVNAMLDELTIGELDDLESELGPLEKLRTAQLMAGCVWIARRREDPNFTLEDARQVRITALDVADPTTAADGAGG